MNEWWKLTGWCGVIFVALFVISIIVQGSPPSYDDSIEDIRAYFVDDGDNYLIAHYLLGLASVIFFIPFASGLSHYIGLAERGPQWYARLIILGAVLLVTIAAAASVAWGVLAFAVAEEADEDLIRALMYMDYIGFNALPFTFALIIGATAVVQVLESVLWVWLAFVGFVVVVIDLLAPLSQLSYDSGGIFSTLSAIAFMSFLVWVLLTSAALITRTEEPHTV